jgi:hypothetical protein
VEDIFSTISALNANRVSSSGKFVLWDSVVDEPWNFRIIRKGIARKFVFEDNGWQKNLDIVLLAYYESVFKGIASIKHDFKPTEFILFWWADNKFDACFVSHCDDSEQAIMRCGFLTDYKGSGWYHWMSDEEFLAHTAFAKEDAS